MAPSLRVAAQIRPYFILALDGGPATGFGLGFISTPRTKTSPWGPRGLAGFSLATLPTRICRYTLGTKSLSGWRRHGNEAVGRATGDEPRDDVQTVRGTLRAVMRIRICILLNLLLYLGAGAVLLRAQENGAPHLEKRGAATQLIVDDKPFLMLSGELHNSSSSSLEYMKPIWPRLEAMGLNSVVTPLSWELVEPDEGKYDFTLVDGLIDQSRQSHERIVFLWLASWKNGMSSYAPVWVKQSSRRFERVVEHGNEVEILSPLCAATQEADARAFGAVMRHIKELDGSQHTVLMMQVENEVGVLGDSRDRSEDANKAFAARRSREVDRLSQGAQRRAVSGVAGIVGRERGEDCGDVD